eukprot:2684250-Lingulodinium_polyedra.AAC.1
MAKSRNQAVRAVKWLARYLKARPRHLVPRGRQGPVPGTTAYVGTDGRWRARSNQHIDIRGMV